MPFKTAAFQFADNFESSGFVQPTPSEVVFFGSSSRKSLRFSTTGLKNIEVNLPASGLPPLFLVNEIVAFSGGYRLDFQSDFAVGSIELLVDEGVTLSVSLA